jgi:glycosyltransferase involved in cell wall biosynthesis
MRIGIITGEYPPMQGGVGAYTAIIAQQLAAHGHDIFVFSTTSAAQNTPSITLTNAVRRWDVSSLLAIRRWANTNRLDIIDVQFQTAAFQMSPVIHFLPDVLRPRPVMTTFHDLRFPYLFPKAGRLRGWIVMRLARASAGVIVTNHEDAARLATVRHMALIPIGSNIWVQNAPIDSARVRAAIDAPNRFLIGYFGLINRSKGLETLLHSLSALRAGGIDARLVMIGGTAGDSDRSNPPYLREIDLLIDSLALGDCVHRTGYVSDADVSAWLQTIDVIALPFRDGASFRRGSLMAAIEHECVIVTTQPNVPIPEFQHDINLLLHPVDDSSALTQALRRVYDNPALRDALRKNIAALKSRFNWSSITNDTLSFFQRVIGATA